MTINYDKYLNLNFNLNLNYINIKKLINYYYWKKKENTSQLPNQNRYRY